MRNSLMRTIPALALGAALATGVATAPAAAAKKNDAPAQPQFKLSKGVRENIAAAQAAVAAGDLATASAKVSAATPLATSGDDRYVIGVTKLSIANKQNDRVALAAAIDDVVASGSVPAADLPMLVRNQGALAYEAKNYAKAEAAYGQLAQLQPDNTDNLISLAELKYQNGKTPEALDIIDKAVASQKAKGQPVSENWYKRARGIAYDAKLKPQTLKWNMAYVEAYPTPTNWRTAIQLFRQDSQLDDGQDLDILRLARVAKALNGERDYFDYANTALERGLPGEASAVIAEGFAANMVDAKSKALNEVKTISAGKTAADKASLPASETRARAAADGKPAMGTADAYMSYGDYAKAAALYRFALTKGGVDANAANTRLGISLARGGQKADALAAFAQVTGPRKPIADYWTIWLNQQA